MSTEPQASSEGGTDPPAMDIIGKLDELTVGMRVEAKDSYGKWYSYENNYHPNHMYQAFTLCEF